jgi:hypothetical protein
MRRPDPLAGSSNVVRLETEPERLWSAFVEARDWAWNSGNIADGIASGRAYAAFLQTFLGPDLPRTIGGRQ